MVRGGLRWCFAIGALVGMLFLAHPNAANAFSPLTITLTTSRSAGFTDDPVTLTATVAPVVADLQIDFYDQGGGYGASGFTDASGVAQATFVGSSYGATVGAHEYLAFHGQDATFDNTSSNLIEVDFSKHPGSVSATVSDNLGKPEFHPVDDLTLNVRTSTPTCDGGFSITELQDGAPVGPTWTGMNLQVNEVNGVPLCGLGVRIGHFAAGIHHFQISYSGSAVNEDAQTVFDVPIVLLATSIDLQVDSNPLEVGSTTAVRAHISVADPTYSDTVNGSTMELYEGSTLVETGTIGDPFHENYFFVDFPISYTAVGTHVLHAVYPGFGSAAPSISPTLTITVVPNTVRIGEVGLGASSFYPIVDGYHDTVAVEGNTGEAMSIAITITNAKGQVVRHMSTSVSNASGYSLNWDGRADAGPMVPSGTWTLGSLTNGAIVPAGVYHVSQVLTDDLGASVKVTTPVTVSLKYLHWYTGSKTLYGNQYSAKGGNAGTETSSSTYSRGMRITLPSGTPGRFAALGYQFVLPSATTYSSLTFSLLGSGSQAPEMGLQDFYAGNWPTGSSWIIDYFSLGPVAKKAGWTHYTFDGTHYRSGHVVRGVVVGANWLSGHYDIAKVELTYRYSILK
jgi:hypothetical protein